MKRSTVIGMVITVLLTLGMLNVLAEETAVESFRSALRNGNSREVKSLIAGGLILTRLFNRNNPGKGQDIIVRVSDIPDNFQIPAANQFPFDLRYLFGGSIRTKSLRYLDQRMNGMVFEESPPGIRQFAQQVIEFANQRTPTFTPTVVTVGDRYLVLTEAESNGGILTGTLAVFEKRAGQSVFRAVIDLR